MNKKETNERSKKLDFIHDLLRYTEKRNIDENSRKKIFALITKEFEQSTSTLPLLLERINIIENELFGTPKKKTFKKKTFKNFHSPKEMVQFLHNFSIDEQFKWFTHDPLNPMMLFQYEKYLANASNKLPKLYSGNINYLTYSNVRNFLFDTKHPCFLNIGTLDYTWKNVEKWCSHNPNRHPFEAKIKDVPFINSINKFKNIIEFREDELDLTFFRRIKDFFRDSLGREFTKTYSNEFTEISQILNIYIDTNLFFRGLKQIAKWILQNNEKSKEVEFTLKEYSEYFKFEILHKNSYYTYKNDHPKILGKQGDFHQTRLNLFSVLDWEIQAKFRHDGNSYKIICLENKKTSLTTTLIDDVSKKTLSSNIVEKLDDEIPGVRHILTLYKIANT